MALTVVRVCPVVLATQPAHATTRNGQLLAVLADSEAVEPIFVWLLKSAIRWKRVCVLLQPRHDSKGAAQTSASASRLQIQLDVSGAPTLVCDQSSEVWLLVEADTGCFRLGPWRSERDGVAGLAACSITTATMVQHHHVAHAFRAIAASDSSTGAAREQSPGHDATAAAAATTSTPSSPSSGSAAVAGTASMDPSGFVPWRLLMSSQRALGLPSLPPGLAQRVLRVFSAEGELKPVALPPFPPVLVPRAATPAET